jgi:hypothetical protein
MKAMEDLAKDPTQAGDWVAKDTTGRPIQVKRAGRFLFSYWPDPFAKELRLIKIEWI